MRSCAKPWPRRREGSRTGGDWWIFGWLVRNFLEQLEHFGKMDLIGKMNNVDVYSSTQSSVLA